MAREYHCRAIRPDQKRGGKGGGGKGKKKTVRTKANMEERPAFVPSNGMIPGEKLDAAEKSGAWKCKG